MEITKFDNTNTFLFVSGMFAGAWMWDNTYPNVPNANHYLMEQPLCQIDGKISTLSDAIVEEVRNIPSPTTLVANSLGGYVSLNVARTIPEKIKSIIISGSAGFAPTVIESINLTKHHPKRVASQVMKSICFNENKITDESIKNITESFSKYFRNIVRLMRESNTVKVEEVLKEVHCPVHAIWGANDIVTPFSSAIEILKRHGITYDLIDDCGHSPMFEKPDKFASLLNAQMDKFSRFSKLKNVA